MSQKRRLEDQDPDYPDDSPGDSKQQRLNIERARIDSCERIKCVVRAHVGSELCHREEQMLECQQRLQQARQALHLLRYLVVSSYYTSSQVPEKQSKLHPAVKKLVGNQKNFEHTLKLEIPPPSIAKICRTEKKDPTVVETLKQPRYIAPKEKITIDTLASPPRAANLKVKTRLVIGNISKWIHEDMREDAATHKWMLYVRGSPDSPDISDIVERVRFFLHASYQPNDVIEVAKSPFHLSRRGWGEFPVRVQVHFQHPQNRPLDVIHQLSLDHTYTGLQTLGAETVVDVWLFTTPGRCDDSNQQKAKSNDMELSATNCNNQPETKLSPEDVPSRNLIQNITADMKLTNVQEIQKKSGNLTIKHFPSESKSQGPATTSSGSSNIPYQLTKEHNTVEGGTSHTSIKMSPDGFPSIKTEAGLVVKSCNHEMTNEQRSILKLFTGASLIPQENDIRTHVSRNVVANQPISPKQRDTLIMLKHHDYAKTPVQTLITNLSAKSTTTSDVSANISNSKLSLSGINASNTNSSMNSVKIVPVMSRLQSITGSSSKKLISLKPVLIKSTASSINFKSAMNIVKVSSPNNVVLNATSSNNVGFKPVMNIIKNMARNNMDSNAASTKHVHMKPMVQILKKNVTPWISMLKTSANSTDSSAVTSLLKPIIYRKSIVKSSKQIASIPFNKNNVLSLTKPEDFGGDKLTCKENTDDESIDSENIRSNLYNLQFKDLELRRVDNEEVAALWLMRSLPLIKDADPIYKQIHPYVVPSAEKFLSYPLGKRRALEAMRAKEIERLLIAQGYPRSSIWKIAKLSETHGFTPGASSIDSPVLEETAWLQPNNPSYSEPSEIISWLTMVGTESQTTHDQIEVNIESLEDPTPTVADADERRVILGDLEEESSEVAGIRHLASQVDVTLTPEQVSPNVALYASQVALLEASKCLAEDLMRRAFAAASKRNNRYPPSIELADVRAALCRRKEFDLFSNCGLGVDLEEL